MVVDRMYILLASWTVGLDFFLAGGQKATLVLYHMGLSNMSTYSSRPTKQSLLAKTKVIILYSIITFAMS
jgi:hypothetical protein